MTFPLYNHGFLRTYSIEGKELINIAFFNENEVVVQTGRGWIEKNNPAVSYTTDVNPFVLDKVPTRKVKVNFAGMYALKQPFYVKETFDGRNGYILYVPFIPGDWTVSTTYTDQATTRSEYTEYDHKKEKYHISVYKGSTPIEDNVNFVNKVRDLFKLAVYHDNDISDMSIIENRETIIDKIKNFNG
jgi:hypothetical protein